MRRGFTLIEMMISVSVLLIFVNLIGYLTVPLHRSAAALTLRERARQVLEYEADARVHHRAIDAAVQRALLADLPNAHVFTRPRGPATALLVSWLSPAGTGEFMELVVLEAPR